MKYLSAYLSLVLVFFVIACGQNSKPTQPAEPASVVRASKKPALSQQSPTDYANSASTEFEDDDCGATAWSSCSLKIDGSGYTGDIEAHGDHDWFSVSLTAGSSYHIIVIGGTSSDLLSLEKPMLRVRAPSTSALSDVTYTDDGTNNLAGVNYTPDVTGEYFIIVSDDDQTDPGRYSVHVKLLTEDTNNYN